MPTKSKRQIVNNASRLLEGDSTPLWQRLEADLRQRIETGVWRAGTMIPGRQRLSEEYNVHIHTVERAIKAMVQDGTLETQGTRGTFVSNTPIIDTKPQPQPVLANASVPVIDRRSEKLDRRAVIGIVSTDDPLSRESETILQNLEKSFSAAGGSAIYINRSQRGRGYIPLEAAVASMVDQACDALVALTYNDSFPAIDAFESMVSGGPIPIVYVSATSPNRPAWNVYYDSFDAGFQVAQHLLSRNCRSFLFLASRHFRWADERLAGITAALKASNVSGASLSSRFADDYDENDLLRVEAARRMAKDSFSRSLPDAVVAVNDHMAHGTYLAAEELGLVAGKDFLLVGFDDGPISRELGMSSMRPPVEELGQCAASLAVRAITGDPTFRRISLSSNLIIRATSANPIARKSAVVHEVEDL
jgi:DNA-binding LacI/PurR family transcriptional regulator